MLSSAPQFKLSHVRWLTAFLFTFGYSANNLSADPLKWTLQTQLFIDDPTAGNVPDGYLPYIPLGAGFGTFAEGSFVYDADTNTFSDIDLTVAVPVAYVDPIFQVLPHCDTQPTFCGTFHLTSLAPPPFRSDANTFQFYLRRGTGSDRTGDISFSASLSTDVMGRLQHLSDAGGTFDDLGVAAGTCDADCLMGSITLSAGPGREININGQLLTLNPQLTTTPASTTSAVPEPSSLVLVISGMLALGLTQRLRPLCVRMGMRLKIQEA
jgi:hypothetical protein